MTPNEPASLWFVFRSPNAGPLSRRIRCLPIAGTPGHEEPDPALLVWFQKQLGRARTAAEPESMVDEVLGGRVPGFASLFEAVKAKRLPAPKTIAALEKLLRTHLEVANPDDNIRVTEHTLRVLTEVDGVPVAYAFFDDETLAAHPDRLAFLMLEDPNLPDGVGAGAFRTPVKATPLLPAGIGAGTTYACLFTHQTGFTPPGQVVAFPGVRLPDLAAHLRTLIPPSTDDGLESWPQELRRLRTHVGPNDRSLTAALTAAAAESGAGAPIIHEHEHVTTMCAPITTPAGHQQWVLFDDRWAATHPQLAGAIMRAASEWDPFPWRKPKKKAPKVSAADTLMRAWSRGVDDRTEADAQPYQLSGRYAVGTLLRHAHFGLGAVESVDGSKISVVFQDARRTLVHGKTV